MGKTSLIKRFLYDKFEEQYCETVEDDYRKILDYNDTTCDVTILDTAGNHQFPAMRRLAIESCHGFILVYSVDCRKSFEEVKRLYNIIVDIKKSPNVPIILVGNKSDTDSRVVPNDDAYILINAMGSRCEFIEASAKFNSNIKLVFYDLLRLISEEKNESLEMELINKNRSRSRISSLRASFSHVYKTISPDERRRKSSCNESE